MGNQTESINELAAALAKAQGQMEAARFNKTNTHFRQKYADFTSVREASRKPLADNGLAVMQYCEQVEGKYVLVTLLAHTSGQWIKSYFPLTPKDMSCQSIGSAMTYAKRYGLSAMLGIVADDDDDGEAAMGRVETTLSHDQVDEIEELLQGNVEVKNNMISHYKVNRLHDIPSSEYDLIVKRLRGRRETVKS